MSQRILVIDDHESTRELLELVLQEAGYETIGHADHATAYDWIREVHPDLVITDLMDGPWIMGCNTLMLARLDPTTREIPGLLMSSNTNYLREHRQYLRERGCETLEKPFTLEQLLAKVVAAVGVATAEVG
ncbi:MAG TPA: response regulator [Herpetosiphonaceae bacterium]|nr:response regulator [Herpetosiphonaceae bacterium]